MSEVYSWVCKPMLCWPLELLFPFFFCNQWYFEGLPPLVENCGVTRGEVLNLGKNPQNFRLRRWDCGVTRGEVLKGGEVLRNTTDFGFTSTIRITSSKTNLTFLPVTLIFDLFGYVRLYIMKKPHANFGQNPMLRFHDTMRNVMTGLKYHSEATISIAKQGDLKPT